VTARKSGAVNVHGGSVPAGNIHFVCHLADVVTEGGGDIDVPGVGDHHGSREADGTAAGEVVVDGSRAVAVVGAYLINAVNAVGLVAAQRNQAVHLLNGQLIQQGVPHGVVIFQAAQLDQFGAARSAGDRGFGVGVV